MLRSLLMACVLVVVPLLGHANPTAETEETDFLDLVDGEGNVLIQARGVDAVNAEARTQGLAFPALGYWSVEGHCFVKPAPGDCENNTRLPATKPAVTTTAASTSKPSDVLGCMLRACAAGLPMARPCLAFNVCEQTESVDTSTVEPGALRRSS